MNSASTPESIVVVGAGMAGTGAAATLRDEGFDGSLTLLTDESARPYDHVPLSKHFLLDEPGFHDLFLHDERFYDEHEIDLRLDTEVTAIDVAHRSVTVGGADHLRYDRLLLATGAAPRRLSCPGADLAGVHHLRTLADADTLKRALADAENLVVVGDGFIGCEVAASARTMGISVTVVGRGPLPMRRALGDEIATYFRDVHVAHGVRMRPNRAVVEVVGTDRVEMVRLDDGSEIVADAVVVGIGAIPRTDLARDAGLTVDDGVRCDEFGATDAPGVYAAGDVAAAWDPDAKQHIRREHWASALHQGPAAARNMLGARHAYSRTPFFFTDQYDIWMEYTGVAGPGDELVVRGDPSAGEAAAFIAFWLRDGRLVAGMNVNIKGVPPVIRKLVESRRALDRTALADPRVELSEL